MARSRQLSIRSRRRSDVASILRSNDFNAEVTALKLWRQGISSLDIALAPCLSEPQKHDLIDAVDKLSNVAHLDNSSNLGNEREVIMVDDKDNAVSNEDGMEELDKDKLNSLYGAIPVTITLKDCYGNVITRLRL